MVRVSSGLGTSTVMNYLHQWSLLLRYLFPSTTGRSTRLKRYFGALGGIALSRAAFLRAEEIALWAFRARQRRHDAFLLL